MTDTITVMARKDSSAASRIAELRAQIDAIQSKDRLAPVWVIVRSGRQLVPLRRRLADFGAGGLADVRIHTLRSLAADLAAGRLAELNRFPRTPMQDRAATVRAMREVETQFTPFRLLPATVSAVLRTAQEMESTNLRAEAGIAGLFSRLAAVRDSVGYGEQELFETAAEQRTPAKLISFLTERDQARLSPGETKFLKALGDLPSIAEPEASPELEAWWMPSEDAEARACTASILEHLQNGIHAHRIVVLMPGYRTDGGLLRERLESAGIAYQDRQHHSNSPVAMLVFRLFNGNFAFEDLDALLTLLPLEKRIWRKHLREANVLNGLAPVLGDLTARQKHGTETTVGDLIGFLEQLRSLGEPPKAGTWPEHVTWHRSAVSSIGVADDLAELFEELTKNAAVDPIVSHDEYRLAFQLAMADLRSSTARTGVVLGDLSEAGAIEADVVFAIGLGESRVSQSPVATSLLTPAERETLGLPEEEASAGVPREDLFADLVHSAPRIVLSAPRTRAASGSESRPAWEFLAAVAKLTGHESVTFENLAEIPSTRQIRNPASLGEDLGNRRAITETEFRLQNKLLHLPRTEEAMAARRSERYSVWDGHVPKAGAAATAKELSATGLETYAECPYRFFLSSVLRIAETEKVEPMDAADRMGLGEFLHGVLKDFKSQAPGDQSLGSLRTLFETAAEAFQTSGKAGPEKLWQHQKGLLWEELQYFFLADHKKAEFFQQPVLLERAFQRQPLFDLAGVLFRGKIDRVDKDANADTHIYDYKLRASKKDEKVSAEDPTGGGLRYQLPIYAEAIAGGESVSVAFWPLTGDSRGVVNEIGWNDELRSKVIAELRPRITAMQNGYFPAVPGVDNANCAYCPFDLVCPADRERRFAEKRDPKVAFLVPPEAEEGQE